MPHHQKKKSPHWSPLSHILAFFGGMVIHASFPNLWLYADTLLEFPSQDAKNRSMENMSIINVVTNEGETVIQDSSSSSLKSSVPALEKHLLKIRTVAGGPKDSIKKRLTIATVCVDEGDRKSPDNQINTARDYMNMTMANMAAYASHHGYDFSPLTSRSDQLPDKDVRYHKLIWVKQLMQNYEWVFFTDCDALFLDFSIDLSRWVPEDSSPIELVLTSDHGWAMNSGQFLMRNGTWAKQLLDDAMKEPKHTHGCLGNDNAAFNWLLWGTCEWKPRGTRGNFATSWNNLKQCEAQIQKSQYKEKMKCAPMYCYPKDYARVKRQGPVFRLHVAGPQHSKVATLKKYAALVKK